MAKLIFFGLVLWLIWTYFRRKAESKMPSDVQPPLECPAEMMVSCAHCGLCLPAAESIQRDNTDFCCAEHADLGASAKAAKPTNSSNSAHSAHHP